MTNNAFLYIRAKCNAKQGESKLSELAAMTVGTGILLVDGDVVIEFSSKEEGKCLDDLKKAVKSGLFNIVILDRIESISEDKSKAESFILSLLELGAIVLIRRDDDLVLFRAS